MDGTETMQCFWGKVLVLASAKKACLKCSTATNVILHMETIPIGRPTDNNDHFCFSLKLKQVEFNSKRTCREEADHHESAAVPPKDYNLEAAVAFLAVKSSSIALKSLQT